MPQRTCPVCKASVAETDVRCPVCTCVLHSVSYEPTKKTAVLERHGTAPAPLQLTYVGFNLRLFAVFVDTMLILAVVLPCMRLVYGSAYFTLYPLIKGPLDILITWILPALAVILFWIIIGATPGKMFIGARIVDAVTGKPASPLRLILRYYAYFASALPLCAGFMSIASDKKKQGWHDKLAGTVVIQIKRSDSKKSR